MSTSVIKKIQDFFSTIRPKDLIYPGVLLVFSIIVLVLFSIATGFISENLNTAFSDNASSESRSLNMANYSVVTKKLGINIDIKEVTPATTTETPASAPPQTATTTQALDRKAYTLNILNGTASAGLASSLATLLESEGFAKAKTGNEKTMYATTTVTIKESKASIGPLLLEIVRKTYPDAISTTSPDTALFDVTITIGVK